ncbi:MAG: peroxide stress protein YaaA [Litoreibacter sp.]|nr:peroxide stress protein YaaA [Litoreibacter sp.]
MLTVISPAKKLDMSLATLDVSLPEFQDDANKLASSARRLSKKRLGALMGLSDSLTQLNFDRFQAFDASSTPENSKAAALIFAGDTYTGLEAASLDADEMDYAQDHLRILSGLYGLLKPKDAIQPYRLEMGSKLKTGRANSLYEYWGDKLALALNALGETQGTDLLVNCASQEYFGAVDQKALTLQVITPTFLEEKPGGPKIVSFFAKQARGAMARFIVQNRVTTRAGLEDFDLGGYSYLPDQSTPENPVFYRSEDALNALRKAS